MEFLGGPGKACETSHRFEYSESRDGQRGWRIRALEDGVVLHKGCLAQKWGTGEQEFTLSIEVEMSVHWHVASVGASCKLGGTFSKFR